MFYVKNQDWDNTRKRKLQAKQEKKEQEDM